MGDRDTLTNLKESICGEQHEYEDMYLRYATEAKVEGNRAAENLENFLRVSTEQLKDFASLTGNRDVHGLAVSDLCTTSSEISNYTAIAHV